MTCRRGDGARTRETHLLRLGLGELRRALHRVFFLGLRVHRFSKSVELLLQRRDLLLRQEERRLRLGQQRLVLEHGSMFSVGFSHSLFFLQI